jgi:hypothetical protein
MWFYKRTRQAVKEAHPDWGVAEVGTEMGQQWQALATADQRHLQRLAAADKQHYEQVCSEAREFGASEPCSMKAAQPAASSPALCCKVVLPCLLARCAVLSTILRQSSLQLLLFLGAAADVRQRATLPACLPAGDEE